MALVPCRECKHLLSSDATRADDKCPNCLSRYPAVQPAEPADVWAFLGMVLLAAIGFTGWKVYTLVEGWFQ